MNPNVGQQSAQGGAVPPIDPAEFQDIRAATLALAQIVQNTHQNGAGNLMTKVAELRPDFFYGTDDPTILENWLRDFGKILDSVRCPENRRVEIVVYYFKGEADEWWTAKGEELRAQAGFGWGALKQAMREQFYPDHVKDGKFKEFLELKQGNDNLATYRKKFMELMKFGRELVPTEASKVKRFLGGLNYQVRTSLGAVRFATIMEAYGAAQEMQRVHDENKEEGKKRKSDALATQNRGAGNNEGDKRNRPNHNQVNYYGNRNNGGQGSTRVYICKICNNNHPGVDCQGNKVTCFYCGKLGHRKNECRARPQRNNNGNNDQTQGNNATVATTPPTTTS